MSLDKTDVRNVFTSRPTYVLTAWWMRKLLRVSNPVVNSVPVCERQA